jgi:uncharacterized phosphosugar-binding protein
MTSGAEQTLSAGRRYLALLADLLVELARDEWAALRAGAEAVADAVEAGRTIHVFGTGHSHMLAEEMFYRAGGLAAVNPVLIDNLMLHSGAELSTRFERLDGLAEAILPSVPMNAGDVLLVASNSGGNAVTGQLAILARQRGVTVIAITSMRHATAEEARSGHRLRLHDVADIVIDNHGDVGDASVPVPGFDRKVAPTSTVTGAAIVNTIVAEATEILVGRGVRPDVFASSNTAGGDEINSKLVARYRDRVAML